MKHEEKIQVCIYLKCIGIKTMEIYEEFYDHIISSFIDREKKEQTIDEHIKNVIQPNFGGVKGIKKIMRSQKRTRQKMIYKRFIVIFKEYLFTWPSIVITLSSILLIFLLNDLIDPKTVLIVIMILGVLIPASIGTYRTYIFHELCSREGRPYRHSDLNKWMFVISMIGVNFFNIVFSFFGGIVFGSQSKGLEIISQFEFIQIALCVFFTLYLLVCLRLFKENFILKLNH